MVNIYIVIYTKIIINACPSTLFFLNLYILILIENTHAFFVHTSFSGREGHFGGKGQIS